MKFSITNIPNEKLNSKWDLFSTNFGIHNVGNSCQQCDRSDVFENAFEQLGERSGRSLRKNDENEMKNSF
jgi:hypothetical protein